MLTDAAIRNAKPADKPRRLYDTGGLYLQISSAGGKLWRLKYRHEGKEKLLALGKYPATSLDKARKARDKAREQLAGGIDPGEAKKAEKAESEAKAVTFEIVAREWHDKRASSLTGQHRDRVIRDLERDIFPWLGSKPIADITAPELLTTIKRIEARGAPEMARRLLQVCGQVLRYGWANAHCTQDVSAILRGAIPPQKQKHHASLTKKADVANLLRDIEYYQGAYLTRCALQLSALTFVRPGELRHAEWSEFDLEAAEWRIPAEKMKARVVHIVPLARQAMDILKELHRLTGACRYLFSHTIRPMSESTVNSALRRMGYAKGQMTAHGFRSMASTLLNEKGFNRDWIERQLAHGERDSVRAAYNYAEHLSERRKMMAAWADYLDRLRAGAKVLPLHGESQTQYK